MMRVQHWPQPSSWARDHWPLWALHSKPAGGARKGWMYPCLNGDVMGLSNRGYGQCPPSAKDNMFAWTSLGTVGPSPSKMSCCLQLLRNDRLGVAGALDTDLMGAATSPSHVDRGRASISSSVIKRPSNSQASKMPFQWLAMWDARSGHAKPNLAHAFKMRRHPATLRAVRQDISLEHFSRCASDSCMSPDSQRSDWTSAAPSTRRTSNARRCDHESPMPVVPSLSMLEPTHLPDDRHPRPAPRRRRERSRRHHLPLPTCSRCCCCWYSPCTQGTQASRRYHQRRHARPLRSAVRAQAPKAATSRTRFLGGGLATDMSGSQSSTLYWRPFLRGACVGAALMPNKMDLHTDGSAKCFTWHDACPHPNRSGEHVQTRLLYWPTASVVDMSPRQKPLFSHMKEASKKPYLHNQS